MTVKELIEKLDSFNQDYQVFVFDIHGNQIAIDGATFSTGSTGVSHSYKGIELLTRITTEIKK